MEEVRRDFKSGLRISTGAEPTLSSYQQPPFTLSPTAFPGSNTVISTTEPSVKANPMFPDMRRDEFMSKSTISTKETTPGGDHWSVSSASEEPFRSHQHQQQQQPRESYESRGRPYERDAREFESRDYDPRGRRDASIERRPRDRPVLLDHQRSDLRSQSKGRPRERFETDEQEVPLSKSQYDDDCNERYGGRYRSERKPQFEEEYRRPQHLREEDGYASTVSRPSRGQPQHFREEDGYATSVSRTPRGQYLREEEDDYAAPPSRTSRGQPQHLREENDYAASSPRAPRGQPQHLREDDDYATSSPRAPRGQPQHLRENDDYAASSPRAPRGNYDPYGHDREKLRDYHDPRQGRERFPPRSPRAAVRNPRSVDGITGDTDYRRRGKSPQRSDHGGYNAEEQDRRRGKSPQRSDHGSYNAEEQDRRRGKSPQRSDHGNYNIDEHDRRRGKSPQRSDHGSYNAEEHDRRRGKSPQRSDYGGYNIDEHDQRRERASKGLDYGGNNTDAHEDYDRISSRGVDRRGRSKSRARQSDERGDNRLYSQDDGWDEEVSPRDRRHRSPSRGRSISKERRGGRRDYEPYDPPPSSNIRDPRPSSKYVDDYNSRERPKPRPRARDSDYGDDDSDVPLQFEVCDDRRGRRTQRYDDDDDDDESSASSLLVERGASRHIDVRYAETGGRDLGRDRGRSRSIERNPQRRRSKSREKPSKKGPSEFVIDISQPTFEVDDDDRGGVTFSPSTEIPRGLASEAGSSRMSEDHSQRIADANLMKEQSEARHQILKEVRQAMEMRDIATTTEDRVFWGRQVSTLNASLKKLWENYDPSSETKPKSEVERNHTSHSPAASVHNYTTVKVQAPDDLPAGHQFTIRVNGKPLKAQVPGGGVRKGDVFTIRIPLNAPPATPARSPSTTSMIKVRAPASLPEGYRFTAKMGDRTIVATVPPGGVQKGEIFAVPVSDYI